MRSVDEDTISSATEQSTASIPKSYTLTSERTRWSSLEFINYSVIYLLTTGKYNIEYYVIPNNPSYLQHVICILLVGMPIQYMQVAIGQYTQKSSIYMKYMSPIGHGIGYSMIVSTLLRIFPNGVMAGDSLLYLLNCIQTTLPWHVCDEKYESICWGEQYCNNQTTACISRTKFLPSYLYWNLTFMKTIPTEFEISTPDIRRLVTIVCMWIIIFTIVLHTTTLVTQVIRYLFYISFGIITIIAMVLLSKRGSNKGFGYMTHVSVDQITSPDVWANCLSDVLVTFNLGFGGFVLLGSHLSPETYSGSLTVLSTVIFICMEFIHMVTLYLGFAILKRVAGLGEEDKGLVMGNISEDVTYTIIPNSLLYTNVPQLWSFLYFASSIMLSYTSVSMNLRIVEMTLADIHPNFHRYRKYILFAFLGFSVFTTMFFTTKGTFIYSGFNYTLSLDAFSVVLVCAFTTIVSWIYGVQKLCDDIHFIIGVQPTKFWKIFWYFSPLFIGVSCILEIKTVGMERNPFAIFMFILLITPFVALMIREMFRYMKKKNLVGLFQPEELWGPPGQDVRHMRAIFNPRREIRSRRRNETCLHKCLIASKILKRVVGEEEKFQACEEGPKDAREST